ncbi:MAG: hypothetical protein AAGL96_19125 [Pseudomonadota bacterium]
MAGGAWQGMAGSARRAWQEAVGMAGGAHQKRAWLAAQGMAGGARRT